MMLTLLQDNLDYLLWGNLAQGQPGGLLLTVGISLAAGVLATLGGLAGGIALTMGSPRLKRSLTVLVQVLRAIPVLMLIFWCYFLLPILFGIDIPGVLTVIAALALINAAYLSQSVQAGIAAIGKGQWMAGAALGMTRWQTLRHIILPPALRHMLPSFINQWITLLKDSSLAYVVGVAEFTFVATQINNREQVYPLQVFGIVAMAYLLLCSGLEWGGRRLAGNTR
jgi:polar amino acid transport system permease protein